MYKNACLYRLAEGGGSRGGALGTIKIFPYSATEEGWPDPTFHYSFRICSENFKIRKNGKVSIFSTETCVGGKEIYVPH